MHLQRRLVWLLLLFLLFDGFASGFDTDREPGTLLLNMLIKDEADNLERSLPKWAPLIDYWIVGVDSKNTDNSEEVIKKHLGHIPGEIMYVEFDGMGPTWTQLVKRGIVAFPNATHGIVSDADFTPLQGHLDKYQLRRECSKHLYKIRSDDKGTTRNMDWIYRNIEGARVERRTHQSVMVPSLPNQEVYQTLIDLTVQEYRGGYQDRSGGKSDRYLNWLLKDLEEMPEDPRTIYYLGHAHMDMIGPNAAQDVRTNAPGAKHVHEALRYFKWRSKLRWGYHEERWFAMLKGGEICERFLADYQCSLEMWHQASKLDPERADAWFYIGQHHRLAGEFDQAVYFLHQAISISFPHRSLFQWEYLYNCLRHLEFGRAVNRYSEASQADWKQARKSMKMAAQYCPSDFADEVKAITSRAKSIIKKDKKDKKAKEAVDKKKDKADTKQQKQQKDIAPPPPPPPSIVTRGSAQEETEKSREALQQLAVWYAAWQRGLKEVLEAASAQNTDVSKTEIPAHIVQVLELLQEEDLNCQLYSKAVGQYLSTFDENFTVLKENSKARPDKFWAEWLEANLKLWPRCRASQ